MKISPIKKIAALIILIFVSSFVIERSYCKYYDAHPPLEGLQARTDASFYYDELSKAPYCQLNSLLAIPGMAVFYLIKHYES